MLNFVNSYCKSGSINLDIIIIFSYVCTGGSSTPTPNDNIEGYACPPGYMCPAGSTVPIGCPIGTWNGQMGQANCTECLAGLMCDAMNMTIPVQCKEGMIITNSILPVFWCI